jgi:hypothetical protein
VGGKVVLVGFAGRGGVMEQLSLNRVLLRQAVLIGYVSFDSTLSFLYGFAIDGSVASVSEKPTDITQRKRKRYGMDLWR